MAGSGNAQGARHSGNEGKALSGWFPGPAKGRRCSVDPCDQGDRFVQKHHRLGRDSKRVESHHRLGPRMQIKTIEPIAVSLPMLKPVIMAGEEVRRADNVLVRIETDNGVIGWGGGASCSGVDGEAIEKHLAAIQYY